MIKEIENFAELSKSEQAEAIAKLQKELNKLKEEYDKTKDEIKEVKSVYTYKFAVKDTAGKGVQGLSLTFTNIEDSTKVYVGTSDENGDIIVKGIAEGTYKIAVTHVPTGYKVVQKGKMVSEVKSLFRPAAEVKAENNVEKKEEAKESEVVVPEYVTIKGAEADKKDEKENKKDEKVIDGGTIVVEKEKDNKDNEKKPENNKKPEKLGKEDNKKPAKTSKKEKAELPKAGAAAEAATIAAAAMATMGGAYLSLKKRK